MSRDFVGALLQLNAEKQVSREQLIGAVEDGIQSAYRRVAGDEDIHVRIDAEPGRIRVYRARRVVDEIEDEMTEITVDEARKHEPEAKVGDLVETEQLDGDVFGRIGAQGHSRGGSAVLTDCVPSKTLVATAEGMTLAAESGALGVRLAGEEPDVAGGVADGRADGENRRVEHGRSFQTAADIDAA